MNGSELLQYSHLLAMLLAAGTVACVITGISYFFGPRAPNQRKLSPYECGVEDIIPLPRRFPVKFLQVAMLFLIFDVEAIALYPAVSVLKAASAVGEGFYVLATVGSFLALILLGFVYEWKKGAFEWIS
ncbi:NADH-quinone oxidoreductase subunit A [bacterium]|nr:NADH-quinone oxidoreductase subunit A [bacterium]